MLWTVLFYPRLFIFRPIWLAIDSLFKSFDTVKVMLLVAKSEHMKDEISSRAKLAVARIWQDNVWTLFQVTSLRDNNRLIYGFSRKNHWLDEYFSIKQIRLNPKWFHKTTNYSDWRSLTFSQYSYHCVWN